MLRSLLSIGAIIVLLAISGCGGGGDEDPTTDNGTATGARTAPADNSESAQRAGDPDKAEFIEKADRICYQALYEAETKVVDYEERNGLTPTTVATAEHPAKIARDIVVPVYQREVEELESLAAPKGDEQSVKAIVGALREAVGEAREQGARFVRSWATGDRDPFATAERLAGAYGLAVCSGRSSVRPE